MHFSLIHSFAQVQVITTIAGNGNAWSDGDGGPATAAAMSTPAGIATDISGNIYVAISGSGIIRKINNTGIVFTIVGALGYYGFGGDGGPASAAMIKDPHQIAVDNMGNLYIADWYNSRVRKIDPSGIITTVAGTGFTAFNGDGIPATDANVGYPWGVAVDASGNLYISDETNNRIRKVNTSGIISTIAGTGMFGFSGDGGPATAAMVNGPEGINVDALGNIYFGDYSNYRIRKINALGIISTVAGDGTVGYSGDGSVATACHIRGYTPVTDAYGNIIIAGGERIMKVNTMGIINTVTGTGIAGFSGDGCIATAAKINNAQNITIDNSGNILISDKGNWRVRKVYNDVAPHFLLGHSTGITVCESPLADSISSLLKIWDPDLHQGETWSVVSLPLHGMVASADTATAMGDTLQPHNMYYLPTVGYSGNDSFKVQVTDCAGLADTISIHVTINYFAGITGAPSLCVGSTTVFADSSSGGTWSSNDLSIATVGSSTGIVTGINAGTATITYSSAGCASIKTVTVNALPAAITGATALCVGSTQSLSDVPAGGSWSSASPGIAAIGSISGVVTGVSAGTTTITYTLSTGCIATIPITISPSPVAITGTASVCEGATATLTDATGGGIWSSSSPGVATIGSTSGVVTGMSAGTTVITYTLPAGCFTSKTVTVNPLPAVISGTTLICSADSTLLSNATPGGAWSSGTPAVAIIGTGSGMVTGVAAGTTLISYTLPTGCRSTLTFTVDISPTAITGSPILCVGNTTVLSDGVAGGGWISSNPSVASVDVGTGIVTGVALGTATITYIMGSGCMTAINVTVNSAPSPITGVSAVCVGSTTALSDLVPGGVWSSASPTIAAVGSSSGIVTGIAPGTANVTYSTGAGCTQSMLITVYASPAAISGPAQVCNGQTITLTDGTPGGTWSSSNPAIASVGSASGVVTGVAAGTATISYTTLTGTPCSVTKTITVNPLPAAITGTLHVCPAMASALSDGAGGGTWSSSNTAIATIGSSSGIVTGVAPGTTVITYTLPTGCSATAVVTVNPSPSAISGVLTVCPSVTTTLTATPAGGTWSRSNTNVSVGSGSGVVTGITAGTTIITYTLPATGCISTATVTVNTTPPAISGTLHVCPANTTTLSDPATGGTWSSGNPAIATVGSSSGIVTGVVPGTTTITYSIGTGCSTGAAVTVNTLPGTFTVSGGGSYCAGGAGLHVGLSGSLPGINYQLYLGTTAVGGPLAGTGSPLDFGIQSAGGVYTVTATNSFGCSIAMTGSATITVNPLPPAIGGPSSVCVSGSAVLTDPATGGTWVSGTPAVATIGSGSGLITGVAIGTTTVTYTLPTGCSTTTTISVTTGPSPISGAASVCAGATTMLTDGVGGGTWASSDPAIAGIGSLSGVVTGVSTGSVLITYTLGTGCTVYKPMTVNPAPAAITGSTSLCVGGATTLGGPTGGTWSSGTPATATIGPTTGFVTAISAGITTISYTLTTTDCITTTDVTVNPNPATIAGPATVCVGTTITETDPTTGGTWSTASTLIAIGSASGDVTGITAGAANITYSIGACITTRIITVNPVPAITGAATVCTGSTTTFTGPGGGTWSSSAPGVATVGSTSGVVTGISAGSTTITYTTGTGCVGLKNVTVNTTPAPIGGSTHVCATATTLLTDGTTGGTWSSSTPAVATVGSGTGMVAGVAPGTSIITYNIGGCISATMITVNPIPAAISGTLHACPGSTSLLTDATTGGSWSSNSLPIATVGAGTGIVTGITPGTATISYTLGTGCAATAVFTVNTLPTAITGSTTVCQAVSATLSVTPAGGVWSSADPAVAVIDPGTGVLTGVGAGSTGITYSLGPGCNSVTTVTVFPVPAAITGTAGVCIGTTSTLSDTTSGGAWSSVSPAIASVGSATGLVTGLAGGVVIISYTIPNGCAATRPVTVSAVPAIAGLGNMCAWFDSVLVHDADTTGVYTSVSVTVHNVGGGAAWVLAHGPGPAIIYYTIPSGCSITGTLNINPLPAPIVGTDNICVATTTTYTDLTGGGVWSSGTPGIATVGSSSGIVTGISGGTAMITYTLPTGCKADTVITISTFPSAGTVAGPADVCLYGTATLTDAIAGGVWSSAAPAIATIAPATGVVTGVAAGTANISYAVTNVCGTAYTSRDIIVDALPNAGTILGSSSVCETQSIVLGSSVPGGTWSATNGHATVSSSGIVTGVTAGTDTIRYSVSSAGCTGSSDHLVMVIPVTSCPTLGVAQPTIATELRIWPSPNDGMFNIRLTSSNDEEVHVIITNITGEKVEEFTTRTNEIAPVRFIAPAGVYFISAVTATGAYAGKVVVE